MSRGAIAADCIFCGEEFASLNAQAAHSKARIMVEMKLICSNIVQVCASKPILPFPCEYCEDSFPTSRGKTTHLNYCARKPAPVANFDCIFCGTSFMDNKLRLIHQYQCKTVPHVWVVSDSLDQIKYLQIQLSLANTKKAQIRTWAKSAWSMNI